jgi:hypothetical protein
MRKNILLFGSIAGGLLTLWMVVAFGLIRGKANITHSEVFGYSIMVLALGISMVLAILRFRKDNEFTLRKGIMLCLGLGALTSLFYLASWAFTYHFLAPDFVDNMISGMQKQFDAGKLTEKQFHKYRQMMLDYKKPLYFIVYTLIEVLPVALILGLLIPSVFHLATRKRTAAVN